MSNFDLIRIPSFMLLNFLRLTDICRSSVGPIKPSVLVLNTAFIYYRLRQQALELHKRKAVESSQTATDLKLHLDKYHAQLKEAQLAVSEKTSALQQQSFKYKRQQVHMAILIFVHVPNVYLLYYNISP